MQTPSATAKSDSPPSGRTMTRSSSRAASRGGLPKAAADNLNVKMLVGEKVDTGMQPQVCKTQASHLCPAVELN